LATAFDDLLASFTDEGDRQALEGLAAKNPNLKDSVLRQSDYSRKLNEFKAKETQLDQWNRWQAENWVPDPTNPAVGKTKAELAAEAEAGRLAAENAALAEKALGGESVNFSDLVGDLDGWAKGKGFVSTAELQAKEQQFTTAVNAANWGADASTQLNHIALKHYHEFQEVIDPDAFVKEAADKQQLSNLRGYYETAYAAPKRQAAERAKFEAELKQTRDDAEARIKAIEEQKTAELDRIRALSSGSGHSPADMSGAEMGGFQRSYQQLDRTNSEGKPLAPEIGLGEGGIAEFAAEQFVRTGKVGR
jgi:hypothetical protein